MTSSSSSSRSISLSQEAISRGHKISVSWYQPSQLPLPWISPLVRAFSYDFFSNPTVTAACVSRLKKKLISLLVNWFPGASCCFNFQLPKFLVGWIKGAMQVTNSSQALLLRKLRKFSWNVWIHLAAVESNKLYKTGSAFQFIFYVVQEWPV